MRIAYLFSDSICDAQLLRANMLREAAHHLNSWDIVASLPAHCRDEVEQSLQAPFGEAVSLKCRRSIQLAAGVVSESDVLPPHQPLSRDEDSSRSNVDDIEQLLGFVWSKARMAIATALELIISNGTSVAHVSQRMSWEETSLCFVVILIFGGFCSVALTEMGAKHDFKESRTHSTRSQRKLLRRRRA